MGNWNRRWIPRKKFRYQDPPPSPLASDYDLSCTSRHGDNGNNIPEWEIDFCRSARVPWNKVVFTKRYMSWNHSILEWDDLAGKEAFLNAKKRYWEKINGIPCEEPLPDPDMYIEEIDWDSHVDPDLYLDLYLDCRHPDDAVENVDDTENTALEMYSFNSECVLAGNNENPWERSREQGVADLEKESSGWGQWDKMNVISPTSPWDQVPLHVDKSLKHDTWQSQGAESWSRKGTSWGFNQRKNCQKLSSGLDSSYKKPQFHDLESDKYLGNRGWVSVKQISRERKPWKTGVHEELSQYRDKPWGYNFPPRNKACGDVVWGEIGSRSWDWRQLGNHKNVPWDSDYARPIMAGKATYGSCRKREGTTDHASRYKSSRFQGYEYGNPHPWHNENAERRCSFE